MHHGVGIMFDVNGHPGVFHEGMWGISCAEGGLFHEAEDIDGMPHHNTLSSATWKGRACESGPMVWLHPCRCTVRGHQIWNRENARCVIARDPTMEPWGGF